MTHDKNEHYFIFFYNVAGRGAAMPAVLRVCAEGMLARGGGGRCVQVWRVYNFFSSSRTVLNAHDRGLQVITPVTAQCAPDNAQTTVAVLEYG